MTWAGKRATTEGGGKDFLKNLEVWFSLYLPGDRGESSVMIIPLKEVCWGLDKMGEG